MHLNLATVLLTFAAIYSALPACTAQYTGDATFDNFGLEACGAYSSGSDYVVRVAAPTFDSYPGAGSNPNQNPICFKHINVNYQGRSVDVTIVGRCADCPGANLELTPAAFDVLADPSVGRLYGVQWNYE
ncbi:hypothetical protein BGZ59_010083 [Podila verticillata]|uniref:Uncharacterized protein n=1 Tax=Podila verticillata NRRL 6337 TaxID=1069443 RepID=A0A086TM26_9FUNG|nr:hypothetical protein BGZ59_010083 [Podila verticillata]KFH63003.1 hypothetical protein MVEG_11041 [Podila verticillata NRRL 6337]